jgi:hypothetical protein
MREVKQLTQEIASRILMFPRPLASGPAEELASDDDANSSSDVQELLRLGLTLQKVFQGDLPTRTLADLVNRSKAARRQVSRAGFKPDDLSIKETMAAFRNSVPAVLDLMRELDRLISCLRTHVAANELDRDRQRFAGAFKLIYSPHA